MVQEEGPSAISPLVTDQADAAVLVLGSYSSKVEAVVKRVLYITRSSKNNKVLVFSAWLELLDVIGHALKVNGVGYAQGKGQGVELQKALRKFRGSGKEVQDPIDGNGPADGEDSEEEEALKGGMGAQACPVLLLSMKQGGKGLTLNEANHVILCEPGLDPASEMQAIGRVDRIGQLRETFVHRFVTVQSVEEQVKSLARSKWDGGKSTGGQLKVSDVAKLLLTV
jgi:E3 ubiquitin-protein ligase SHPRH